MATIIRALVEQYRIINYEYADPRTNDWFLITTPWPGLTFLGFYLYFIFRLGPALMANRQPMKLERIMQAYDVLQIILSSYLFYRAATLGWLSDYDWRCQPVDYSNTPRAIAVAATVYLYFAVKIVDLFDTVFFVLRKKDNQISFLHVYHHAGMVMASWGGVKYFPGGHGTFLGLVNSFVHVIMYTHYLIMSFKIWKPWWKKYITQLQLIQFVAIGIHFSQLLLRKSCGYPAWIALAFLPQNIFMIVLFGDFYYKTYIKKRNKRVAPEQNGRASSEASNGKPKAE